MRFLLAIALPLFAIDQATKWWIFTHFALIPTEQNIAAFPEVVHQTAELPMAYVVIERGVSSGSEKEWGWFTIVHWANTGAAFSLGSGNNALFIGISAAALIGLLVAWRKGLFVDNWSRFAVALLLAGILGNLTDRFVHGYVVDFLLFDLGFAGANPFPAFNVADSCICTAAGLFIIGALVDHRRKRSDTAGKIAAS